MRFTGLPRQLDHTCHHPQRFYSSLLLKVEWESQTGMYPCSTSSPKVCGCSVYCHGHAAVTGNDWPDTITGKLSNCLITSDLLLGRSGMLRKWTKTSHQPPRGERGISNWYLHSTMLHQPSETGCQIHSKIQKTLHLFGSSRVKSYLFSTS